MGQSFEMLPVAERAQQYRDMADATFLKAQKLDDPVLRAQYLDMAANWHRLATALETGKGDPEIEPSIATVPDESVSPGKAT